MSDLASTSEKDGGPDFAFPMEDAPKDGSILRLLVKFDRKSAAGAFVDTTEPSWTIGTNNMANTGEDQWDIVGWSWEQDVFCNAYGATAIGWLPFHSESTELAALGSPAPAESGAPVWQSGERELALRWIARLLAKLSSKPDHADDCLWLDRLHKMLAHPPAESPGSPSTSGVGDGWQPIETAPKDGRWLELWRGPVVGGGSWAPLVIARWWVFEGETEGTWAWPDETAVDPWHDPDGAADYLDRGDCYDSDRFTHWRALSAAPTQDGGNG